MADHAESGRPFGGLWRGRPRLPAAPSLTAFGRGGLLCLCLSASVGCEAFERSYRLYNLRRSVGRKFDADQVGIGLLENTHLLLVLRLDANDDSVVFDRLAVAESVASFAVNNYRAGG